MRFATIFFLLAAGTSLWLEHELTGDVLVVAQAQIEEAEKAPAKIEELSQAEIDAELKRAQELLSDPDAPKEFTQSKPLPADIAIDLPSDI